jgi:tetratricopeptide (TPR) repeat protein
MKAGLLWSEYFRVTGDPGDQQRALRSFRVCAALEPDPPTLQKIYGLLIASGDTRLADVTPPHHSKVLGEILIQLQDREHFVAQITEVVPRTPDGAEVLEYLASRAQSVGWYRESITLASSAASIRPGFQSYFLLGLAWDALDERRQAIRNFELALSERPADAETWYRLGRVLQRENQRPQSEKAFQAALNALPTHRNAALALAELGHSIDLIPVFERILTENSRDREIVIRLARLFISIHRHQEAVRWLKEFDKLVPNDGEILDLLRQCGGPP